eukprot:g23377.t1
MLRWMRVARPALGGVGRPRLPPLSLSSRPRHCMTLHFFKEGEDASIKVTAKTGQTILEDGSAAPVKFDDYFLRWDELYQEEAEWLHRHGYGPEAIKELPSSEGTMVSRMLLNCLPAGLCLTKRLSKLWQDAWRPDVDARPKRPIRPPVTVDSPVLGIPTASFSTYPGPGTPMHLYQQKFEEREAYDEQLARHPAVAPANALAAKLFGVDVLQTQLLGRFFSDQINIVYSIPQLQGLVNENQRQRLEGSAFHWVGATDPQLCGLVPRVESADAEEMTRLPGMKVVLVSLGSLTVECRWDMPEHVSSLGLITGKDFSQRLWSELLDSFGGRSDVQVILSIGTREEARELLGDLPSNFSAQTFLDQINALKSADLFITHGGANSIKEATLLGVPMIVTPFCVDQPTNGEAIQRYGAGVCFSDLMATPRGELSRAVEHGLGGAALGWRQRSSELGEALRRAGGAQAAAEACLSLLSLRASAGGA